MNSETLGRNVSTAWDEVVQPTLERFIEIPNLSPSFDDEWATNGLQERAVDLFVDFLKARKIEGMKIEILRPEGRTPLVFAEIEARGSDASKTVLGYGHLDKQPPFSGWDDDKGPYQPVVVGDKLYGRGSVDDGYGPLSIVAAIEALQAEGGAHPRCVLVVETGEESGSPDLEHYLEVLRSKLGDVGLIVCPDSGCGDYERLWFTSSLRGMVSGTLSISTVREGLHSGSASGLVPSSFRVARILLDRVEDAATGRILLDALNVEIPGERREQTKRAAAVLGDEALGKFPLPEGARLMADDPTELMLNGTWRPTLSVTGAAGLPALENAGNVLRPLTALKLSFRLPPGVDPKVAGETVREALVSDPPYGAEVSFTLDHSAAGWSCPTFPAWLDEAAQRSSRAHFGNDPCHYGEGGSIPLMVTLGEIFPEAHFIVTGLGGPGSNAHGPNESLDLPGARKITACIAEMIDAAAKGLP